MLEKKFIPSDDTAGLLELNGEKFISELQQELECLNIHVSYIWEQVKTAFNDSVEIDLEAAEPEEVGESCTIRDEDGNTYTVRRIKLYLPDFIDQATAAVPKYKQRMNIISIIITKFFNYLGVELDMRQASVCIALHQEAKKSELTEEKFAKVLIRALKTNCRYEVNKRELYRKLEELVALGIVEVEKRRYSVKEEICFGRKQAIK